MIKQWGMFAACVTFLLTPSFGYTKAREPFRPLLTHAKNGLTSKRFPFESYKAIGLMKSQRIESLILEAPNGEIFAILKQETLGLEQFKWSHTRFAFKETVITFTKSIKNMNGASITHKKAKRILRGQP